MDLFLYASILSSRKHSKMNAIKLCFCVTNVLTASNVYAGKMFKFLIQLPFENAYICIGLLRLSDMCNYPSRDKYIIYIKE